MLCRKLSDGQLHTDFTVDSMSELSFNVQTLDVKSHEFCAEEISLVGAIIKLKSCGGLFFSTHKNLPCFDDVN